MEEHDCKFEKIPIKIDVAVFDPWVYLVEKMDDAYFTFLQRAEAGKNHKTL